MTLPVPSASHAPVASAPGHGRVTLARSRDELAAALAIDDRAGGVPRAVVMTMGALHQGHFGLVTEAARRVGPGGTVVVTIFVNPLQFAAGEDLEAYPRTLEADVEGLTAVLRAPGGQDAHDSLAVGRLIVFAPTPEVMYPHGEPAVRIDPGPIATVLEGATRPTHFAGVAQVVLTLMHLTRPRWALFGRKDAQQLAIVRAMVRDLAVPVEIVPVGIRREADGLAMSSRNAYLSAQERERALALSRALDAGREAARTGADAAGIRAAALGVLAAAPGVEVDYAAVVDPDGFVDLAGAGLGLPASGGTGEAAGTGEAGGAGASGTARPAGPVLLALAAKVGTTRLIDNALIDLR
ncbi:MAG: pantoate--beta-alanine ligase [Actinomyces sp.]|nr:MAG: pantoate--beta-alanine ligase [Actinomyces sp.]